MKKPVRHRWLQLFGFLALLPASAQASTVLSYRAGLEREFSQAAREFSVPESLLRAIAYVETRWDGRNDAESAEEARAHGHLVARGPMGLREDDWFSSPLRAGAALLALEPETVARDPRENIRAAAALLRYYRERTPATRDAQGGITGWAETIRAYSGIPDAADSDHYLSDIYTALAQGVERNGIFVPQLSERFPRALTTGPKADSETKSEDYAPAVWDPSPNFDPDVTPKFVVIHTTQGNFAGAVSWLKNPSAKASAHYVIRSRDGYMKQLVRENRMAWHARCWNPKTIGIEHEGFMSDPDWYTPEMYEASARLTAHLAAKFNIPITKQRIVGHGFWQSPDFPKQTELEKCNDHTDPGRYWDWTGYLARATTVN